MATTTQTVGNSAAIGAALGSIMVTLDTRLAWNLGGEFWAAVLLCGIWFVGMVPTFVFKLWQALHGKPPEPFDFPEVPSDRGGADESAEARQPQRPQTAPNKAEG